MSAAGGGGRALLTVVGVVGGRALAAGESAGTWGAAGSAGMVPEDIAVCAITADPVTSESAKALVARRLNIDLLLIRPKALRAAGQRLATMAVPRAGRLAERDCVL